MSSTDDLPVRIEAGKSYLIGARGRPFLLHGDTAWSLIGELTIEDARHYLDDRRSRGFNAVVVSLLERKYSRNAPRNAYGHAPFADLASMAATQDAYFQHADAIIGEAEARGIVLVMTPSYIGDKGANDGWYDAMRAAGVDRLRDYGRFLGRRYGKRRNIIWMHGGDANPPDRSLCIAIADGIRDEAPASLHTAHCESESMAVDVWGDQPWLALNSLYTYKPVHLQARRAQSFRSRTPSFLLEGAYENEHGAGEHRVRVQAYQAILSGACGHVYGNNPVWHFNASPAHRVSAQHWKAALDSRGARSLAHLRALLESLPWWELESTVGEQIMTQGYGGDDDRAVAAGTADGRLALIYTPAHRRIGFDRSRFSGPFVSATWIDPSSGEASAARAEPGQRPGMAIATPPGNNRAGQDDWLLVLRATTTGSQ